MGQLDHVVHDAVVGQLVDRLQVALQAQGAVDQLSLLLLNLDIDVVLYGCFKLWLEYFDLLVGSVGFALPVRQVHLLLGLLLLVLLVPVLIETILLTASFAVSLVLVAAGGPAAHAVHVKLDLVRRLA